VVLDLIMEGDEAKRVMRGFEVSRMAPRNRAEEEEEDDGEQGGSSALRFLVEVVEVEGPLASVRCCCWAEYLSLSFFMRNSLAGRLRDNRRLIGGVAFSFFSFANVVVVEAGALFDDDDDDVTLRRVWDDFRGGVSNRSSSSFSSWLSSKLSSKKMFVEDREVKRCIGVNR